MHIVLKYNDDIYNVNTVLKHSIVLNERRSVIWGIVKPNSNSTGIANNNIEKLKIQIKNNITTYAFLATRGEITHRCTIVNLYKKNEIEKKKSLIPSYYHKDLNRCVNGIEISKIEKINKTIVESLVGYKTGENVALSNQTNPIYVKMIENKNTINTIENGFSVEEHSGLGEIKSIGPNEMVKYISEYIKSKGYTYNEDDIGNFYLSLKTKPFVLLAGISGTGKSKLVELFSEALGANYENSRFRSISVKPDWNDGSELFGYINLNEEFVPGILSEILYQANHPNNLNMPYFICLDEMNLARVEYYLSDFLSILETRKQKNEEVVSEKMISNINLENSKYKDIYLSDNIFLIGTVNMDETTFSFSKKVLDRANTIEFSDVYLDQLNFSSKQMDAQVINMNNFKTSFLSIKDAVLDDKDYVLKINNEIIAINEVLKRYNNHFGYRVRDEIIFYMLENKKSEILNEDTAFDYQIVQKILPSISGNDAKIEFLLQDLFNLLNEHNKISIETDDLNSYRLTDAKFVRSSKKILDMLKGFSYGYVSFW